MEHESYIYQKIKDIVALLGEVYIYHEKTHPSESKNLKSDIDKFDQWSKFLSEEKCVEEFIRYSYKFWIDEDGKKNREYTMKNLLGESSIFYDITPKSIIDGYWDRLEELMKYIIPYVYEKRCPKEINGKITFTVAYPSGKQSLSLKKIKMAWD